jgi:16S rRNA (guanine966-N2)-methyltransferase
MLRIVAGEWRGRKIAAPPEGVRPTGDRVREAWMSIVSPEIPGAKVLDLFAGSGALGLEALSRGAASVDFVDNTPKSLRTLAANAEQLGAGDRATIHRSDALAFIARLESGAFDLAFADPPYASGLATKVAERWLAKPFAEILGVEHQRGEHLPGSEDRRKYGETVITFFRRDLLVADSAILSAGSDTTDR